MLNSKLAANKLTVEIKKTNFFYKNINKNNTIFRKEFETKKYSRFFHDETFFKNFGLFIYGIPGIGFT